MNILGLTRPYWTIQAHRALLGLTEGLTRPKLAIRGLIRSHFAVLALTVPHLTILGLNRSY